MSGWKTKASQTKANRKYQPILVLFCCYEIKILKKLEGDHMRLKHIPEAEEIIASHPTLITTNGEEWLGKWQSRFPKEQPLHLEVGSGKGRFIIEMAKRYPDINFIGMELQTSAIFKLLEKQLAENLPNLQLLNGNAKEITDYFAPEEIDKIMLTFSDPWPKTKHAKRRFTHERFLTRFEAILKEDGEFYFKTDNRELFEFSLVSMNQYGMQFEEIILDLHNSDQAEDNIMTEFEEKFSNKGERIHQIRARFN